MPVLPHRLTGVDAARGVALMSGSKAFNLAGIKAALAFAGPDTKERLAALPEVLTHGANEALDLVIRYFVPAGGTVLVDDPCYFNFQALLAVHGVRLLGVPYTPTGPDLARFEAVLAEHRPRLYLTNSALQNPTGASLSPQTAHLVLTLAAAHDLTIVEDVDEPELPAITA